MESSHLLSVIVPVRSMEGRLNYLQEWLKKSKNFDLQVILVHDDSGDSTGTELRRFLGETELDQVVLLEGLFGSPGSARNAGIEASSGKWITFWDSDDAPKADTVLGYLSDIVDEKSQMAVGSFQTIDLSNGEVKSQILSDSIKAETILAIGMNPGLWRIVIKRTLIGDSRFPATRMAEDQIFLADIFAKVEYFETTEKIFYTYHKGFLNQLTSRKDAINELPRSLESLSTADYKLKELSVVRVMMVYRQLLTSIKFCSWRNKVASVRAFLTFLIKTRFTLSETISAISLYVKANSRKLRLGR